MDLKAILGTAHSAEIEKAINDALSKDYVPRVEFNTKNDSLKSANEQLIERDKQLEELKKSAKGNEDLQTKIAELQNENQTAKADFESKLKAEKEQRILDTELLKHSPVSLKALKAELDMSKIKFGEDKAEGLDEQLKAFKESDLKALFKADINSEQKQSVHKIGVPKEQTSGGGGNPFNFDFTPKIKNQKETN